MVAVLVDVVVAVVTVKVAEVAPAGIVTDVGTLARVALLERSVTVVAVVDARLSVTVPVDDVPPRTEVGFRVMAEKVTGA